MIVVEGDFRAKVFSFQEVSLTCKQTKNCVETKKDSAFLQLTVAYNSYRLIVCLTGRLIGCSISLWRNQVD